ncbi:trehalase-like [Schistocerca piceifrons]|uniref:trehalase-like n=1 Tax=Schistocerca piceifrons TaxID=274613 RepID=UPI001F5E4E52|nr:trehalase-like [Schistocerca piceifrons]
MNSLFPDSKTFVDMKLRMSDAETTKDFELLLNKTGGASPSRPELEQFVKDHFEPVASEFEKWNPPDWKPSPVFLKKIKDPRLWEFAKKLNGIWKFLGRRITDLVRENQELYSIIYMPYGVIIPGGRFREIYYWDSYWIIRGLLKCEMYYTARGILANFLLMVRQFGLVPNGGRIYYTGRSQPPLLLPMVKSYMDATNDIDFLREHLDTLEKEYSFWIGNRTVTVTKGGKKYRMARYFDDTPGPRPESYREDIHSGQTFHTEQEKMSFYSEIKAAAESGLDFTSRWFIKQGANKGVLTDTKTRYIIPVDLNAIMYWNSFILSRFSKEMGLIKKASYYSNMARDWLEAVDKVLWHEDLGIWLDYDILNQKRREYFCTTNLTPLWAGCFYKDRAEELAERIVNYVDSYKIVKYPGGIPTTLEQTGQQWDFPNAWPPHQDLVISALEATNDPRALRMAREWALRWVYNNYRAWVDTKVMHEKYDVTVFGAPGSGGEYESQMGFGWTNGLVIDLMDRYSDQLVGDEEPDDKMATRVELCNTCKFPIKLDCQPSGCLL